jgi:major type 1 subunit fimbrin (pilin)
MQEAFSGCVLIQGILMKLNKIALSVMSAAMLVAGSVNAADPAPSPVVVNGGTIHFKGDLVNAACAVSTESADKIVRLGQYRTATFTKVGDTSAKVPFTIVLNDCDTSVSSTASVAFTGQTDATDPTLLAIASDDNTTTASGVGIEIMDRTSKVLTPNGSSFSTAQALVDGANTLNFSARYKATATKATAGQANADATFVMKYE